MGRVELLVSKAAAHVHAHPPETGPANLNLSRHVGPGIAAPAQCHFRSRKALPCQSPPLLSYTSFASSFNDTAQGKGGAELRLFMEPGCDRVRRERSHSFRAEGLGVVGY